jgi:hypothetical protein
MLISRALMAAFLEESNIIHPRHIEHAVSSLKHSDIKVQRNIMVPVFAGLAAILVAASLIYFISGTNETPLALKSSETAVSKRTFPISQTQADKNIAANTRPSEAPVPGFKLLNVNVDVAIVRYRPSMDSGKAGWTLKGNQLVVLNETVDENRGKWFQILFQGEKRWISGAVVSIAGLEDEVKPVIIESAGKIDLAVEEIPEPQVAPEEKSLPADNTREVEYSSSHLSPGEADPL